MTGAVAGARQALAALYRNQPVLAAAGALLLLAMLPTLAAMALDARTTNGIAVWIKPVKFQVSLAVHAWTIALLAGAIEARARASRIVRILAAVIALAMTVEIACIMFQAARGQASHYNVATRFDSAIYQLMGIGALAMVAATAALGIVALLRPAPGLPAPLRLAVGLGLVLAGVLAGVTGGYASAQTGHWVGGVADDATGLPLTGWSRSGGDLRVAHFFGLHGMQALPAIGWLALRLPSALRVPAVAGAALAWIGITAAVFSQALSGRPFL